MPVALPLAIVGSAAVGAVASSSAANKASKAATNAANQNNALQTDIYNQDKAALSPYVEAGNKATPAIQALLGLGGDATAQNAAFQNFRDSSGYQDQFAEGQRAVTGALGNRGLLDSGAALKALTRYGQSQSNQSFGNYYDRLVGQQSIGLAGASAQAGVGQSFANSVTNNNNNAANAVGNAAFAKSNAINAALQSGVSAYALSSGMGSSYGRTGGGAPPYYPNGTPYNPGSPALGGIY